MEGYKIVATLGACILAAGVFVPARLTRMAGYISYFSDQQTNGLILIALALMAILLVFIGSPAKLFTFGLLTLTVVAWAYLRRNTDLQTVEYSVNELASQAASMPMLHQVADSITTNTPWWVMLGGSALLVVAGLMQEKKV